MEKIQIFNPKAKRYILINNDTGKILRMKSDKKPYKNIKIITESNIMEKNLCNYISKKGRCKEKAIRVVMFKISDTFSVRTKLCKKHYEETKGLYNGGEKHG